MKMILKFTLLVGMMLSFAFASTMHAQQTAEEWLKEAETAEAEGRTQDAASAYSGAAHEQIKDGDYEAAGDNFKKAAEGYRKVGKEAQANAEAKNAGNAYEKAAEEASNDGDHERAADLYDKAAEQYDAAGLTNDGARMRGNADFERKLAEYMSVSAGNPQVTTKSIGTAKTIGNIANISVTNNNPFPVKTVAQDIYIVANDGEQDYRAKIPGGIVIPPNSTVVVPVNGICTNPFDPPVGMNEPTSDMSTWIAVGIPESPLSAGAPTVPEPMNPPSAGEPPSVPEPMNPPSAGEPPSVPEPMNPPSAGEPPSVPEPMNPPSGSTPPVLPVPVVLVTSVPVPEFDPADIPDIVTSKGYSPSPSRGDIIVTWPGTDIPVGGSFNPKVDPRTYARVIVDAVDRIEIAAKEVQESGQYTTPFTPDPHREYEAICQHSVWIFAAAVMGRTYDKADFEKNVHHQMQTSTGIAVTDLPREQQEEIEVGTSDLWITYMATGAVAKVIKAQPEPEEQEPPIEISEKVGGCEGDIHLKINPPYEVDMKIASEWGSAEERQAIIQEVKDALSRDVQITADDAFQSYDINRHPTSSTAFWKAGNVGGFASAYAKTWFKKADGSYDWVWGTERLETNADGTMDYSMTYTHDETCRAIVAGSALIRIRASSSAFDAMAGNTHLENDTKQLNFLRTTKYFGKKAAEWLILKARGRADKSFANFVKDDIQDQVKGAISDAAMAEAQKLADQALGGLLSEMGISLDQMLNMELPSLEGLLEDLFGVDIPSFEDLTNFIGDGLEAAFNLPFVSNTSATANGSLTVRVGGNTKSVLAGTSVHYARKSTEETKDAMNYTGEKCDEEFVSDAEPDALNIHTQGFSKMVAEAQSKFGFGNGQAEAFLESMNLQVLSGICICPAQRPGIDKNSYEINVQGQMEWYTADKGQQEALEKALGPMLQSVEDQMLEELDAMPDVTKLTTDQFEKMLADKVRAWGEANKFAWRACKN